MQVEFGRMGATRNSKPGNGIDYEKGHVPGPATAPLVPPSFGPTIPIMCMTAARSCVVAPASYYQTTTPAMNVGSAGDRPRARLTSHL